MLTPTVCSPNSGIAGITSNLTLPPIRSHTGGRNSSAQVGFYVLAALALTVVVGGCGEGTAPRKKAAPALKLTIAPTNKAYRVGDPITVECTVRNTSAAGVWLLERGAHLWVPWALYGDTFVVLRNGGQLPYEGMFISFVDELERRSSVWLEPGDERRATVDLSRLYDFSAPGQYKVCFRGVISASGKRARPRTLSQLSSIGLASNDVTIIVEGAKRTASE